MRNKHSKNQNDAVLSHFVRAVFTKYTIPTLCALVPTIVAWFFLPTILIDALGEFDTIKYLYLLCLNIITSIATVSFYHTIRTVVIAVVKLNNGKYSSIQKICKSKYKVRGSGYCELGDGSVYKVYGKKAYNQIEESAFVDLIVISNEYGARMWEFVLKVPSSD